MSTRHRVYSFINCTSYFSYTLLASAPLLHTLSLAYASLASALLAYASLAYALLAYTLLTSALLASASLASALLSPALLASALLASASLASVQYKEKKNYLSIKLKFFLHVLGSHSCTFQSKIPSLEDDPTLTEDSLAIINSVHAHTFWGHPQTNKDGQANLFINSHILRTLSHLIFIKTVCLLSWSQRVCSS